jgi:Glu-tRNA(Gln) amidotransferase subunit E-like FAD-binding protein
MNKEIFARFNIKIDLKESQKRFRNKINNVLFHSHLFTGGSFNLQDIRFRFCNAYGLKFELGKNFQNNYLSDVITFEEYLLRLICIIEILIDEVPDIAKTFYEVIQKCISESPTDLNLRIVKIKKLYSIFPKGSELLDDKLVDDSLNILTKSKYESVKVAFEKGLKEYLESSQDKSKLKNCLRDMQLAMDELSKIVLKDKNVGVKHLIKNENWPKTGLNNYFKKMLFEYNEMLDKLSKHSSVSKFSEKEVESVIYLTGLFIRLILE